MKHPVSIDFAACIGDEVTDKTTSITGEVTHLTAGPHGERGVWIKSVDSTGRPFQEFIDERDLA